MDLDLYFGDQHSKVVFEYSDSVHVHRYYPKQFVKSKVELVRIPHQFFDSKLENFEKMLVKLNGRDTMIVEDEFFELEDLDFIFFLLHEFGYDEQVQNIIKWWTSRGLFHSKCQLILKTKDWVKPVIQTCRSWLKVVLGGDKYYGSDTNSLVSRRSMVRYLLSTITFNAETISEFKDGLTSRFSLDSIEAKTADLFDDEQWVNETIQRIKSY